MPGALGKLSLGVMPMTEGVAQLSNIEESAMAALVRMGITPPIRPGNVTGELPVDLIGLDDNQLGFLLNQMSQYCGFVEFKLSEAKIARNASEERLEFIRSCIRITLKNSPVEGTKLTSSDKDDAVRTNPQVVEATRDFEYKDSLYELILKVRDSAQRNWETVSRRITQRGQEIERMRRVENSGGMGNVPNASRTFNRRG